MKKNQIIISSIILVFLISSLLVLTPIKTATALSTKQISPFKVTISDDQKEMQIGDWKLQFENVSKTCQNTIVTAPNGTITEITINKTDKSTEIIVNGIKTEVDTPAIKSAKIPSAINASTITQSRGQTVDEIISELRQSSLNNGSLPIANGSLPTKTSGNNIIAQSSQITNMASLVTMDNYDPNHVAFSWYGKNFVAGSFPHDDKVYYNIPVDSNWHQLQNGIYDFMLDQYDSSNLPSYLLEFTLGEIIAEMIVELFIPVIGWLADVAEIVTVILGTVISEIIWTVAKDSVIDENQNLWFWLGTGFTDFLASYLEQTSSLDWLNPLNWSGYISDILNGFWSSAYLRIGSITFANNLGIYDPVAPQYYDNSITSTYHWHQNTAATVVESGLLGQSPDYPNNLCALIYAGSYSDMAYIVTQTNAPGAGEVFVNAYSDSGYNSHMRVYVSPNNYNWYLLPYGDQYINSQTAQYYDCGSVDQVYSDTINYVMVLGWDSGSPVSLEVDCVQLIDNPTLTVYSYFAYIDGYEYYDDISTNVKVDGGGVGTSPLTVHVSDGSWSVGFDYMVYDPNRWELGTIQYIVDDDAQYYTFSTDYQTTTTNVNFNHDITLYVVYAV